MSLEGTLETIALPDVLALLSVTGKTGELRVESGGGVGSVWFDAGRVAGYEVGNNGTLVDALFALLRLREGSFKFHTGTQPANASEPQDVAPVLEEAEGRLMQWPAIAAAIPSPASELALCETVDDAVVLRPDQWQLVAAIGSGRQVADVLTARGLGEFEGCKVLKDLVDLRLVHVFGGGAPAAPEASLSSAPVSPPVPAISNGLVVDNAHWYEPGMAAVTEEDGLADEAPEVGYAYAPAIGDAPEDAELAVPGSAEVAQVADSAKGPELSGVWAEGPVAPPESEPAEEPAREPVNRGLLLKFLGSARN